MTAPVIHFIDENYQLFRLDVEDEVGNKETYYLFAENIGQAVQVIDQEIGLGGILRVAVLRGIFGTTAQSTDSFLEKP